jgi:predicted nucleotidyltransferase
MLDPEQVDLADLALALEDHSEEHSWWLDTVTGEVEPHFSGEPDATQFVETHGRRLILVEPLPTAIGYGDMEDFVSFVREPRTRDLLERAIAGRGAFRRFKDALLDYPELRQAWFAFHDARGERRAIEWLLERELVDPDAAEEAIANRPEPTLPDVPGLLDAQGVAHRVALDLQRIYRERLRGVLLFGAWASGEAHPESELELLVVLDNIDDRWEERRRMDRVMFRHSVRNDTVVTASPVTEAELERSDTPLLSRALAEGVRVE